jgi:hypothetical protein
VRHRVVAGVTRRRGAPAGEAAHGACASVSRQDSGWERGLARIASARRTQGIDAKSPPWDALIFRDGRCSPFPGGVALISRATRAVREHVPGPGVVIGHTLLRPMMWPV